MAGVERTLLPSTGALAVARNLGCPRARSSGRGSRGRVALGVLPWLLVPVLLFPRRVDEERSHSMKKL
jgi:hypothetical protein